MLSIISKIIKWIGQHFLGMLFLLLALLMIFPTAPQSINGPENLQEIQLNGPIMDVDDIVKEIEEAQKNKSIKGVLLSVNSPGGSVAPSIEICYAIKELRKKKPVVAYASGIMASGSYYASIHANSIIANPGAIVGSIGVILQSANIQELMDKIGVKTQVVKQGAFKEAGTFTREWSPEEKGEIETLTKDAYEMFVHDVAEARGLDASDSKKFADAHVFSAKRAMNVGLIDEIGVKSFAKKEVEKLAKISSPSWKEKSKIDKLMEKLNANSILNIKGYFNGLSAQF